MASPLAKPGILLVMLLATLPSLHCAPDEEWNVLVVNALNPPNILQVHCQSKDNDLGVHDLPTLKQFEWHFRTNFWGTTLFWCYLAPSNNNTHAVFDAFKDNGELETPCTHDGVRDCIWVARDDGIHLRDFSTDTEPLKYDWIAGRV